MLLPLTGSLIYVISKEKGLVVTSTVAVAAPVLPFPLPTPQWILSASYYWQRAEGQSMVLETFLVLSALALAKSGRPRGAGVVFGLASFDPRFALLGLPLVAAYSRDLRRSTVYAALTFGLTNLALHYPLALIGLLSMVFTSVLPVPPYYHAFIPIVALASLMLLDREKVGLINKRLFACLKSE